MALIILHDMYDWYRDLMDNKSDPRVKDWFMMSSPVPTFLLCVFYAYFSKSLGPKLMAKRKALDLRQILVWYNLFQTIFSAWIFYEYLMSGWWGHYNFRCQPVDYSNNPLALRMARVCWWYYISKFTEFFDTLFFILRKKTQHVSTLHVIHHGCMPFSVWMGMKFAPGGHSTFFALLNSFVHIVMYFYYMIAAMGPKYQKYIWWKKYLTSFQMVQFVAIFTHQFQLLFRECDYPKGFMVWIGLHGVMFLFLFSDFYKAKYTKGAQKVKASSTANGHIKSSTISESEKEHLMANGNGKLYTNGDVIYANGNSNKGACMPVLDDEIEVKPLSNGHLLNGNGHYQNGFANGHILKEGVISTNEAILNSDTSSSSLHQRKVK
ncbi:elongation of very long chain fatty acids protein [Lucilia sericata]|uniref:elongation of very long chain fatty acids protein n=1 Tax=Lucilia sericata TaxID=13632 RepID=UPI0018A83469|nr:elongation of very long chain fatty acids protein [Lucilia sericata]XP_037806326.1 elongation of very long chain fatty acids protein [Lucilia sericata]XP_037806327.1 elongation of very long chain fatty acids protein [Lucilia sericata]XP_037806328.1 elongation of very long chain fatty acids protein [Lucilia sericata]XP_037806329.1 elongation of very long chain fatty acids protein [Lucilia sericata]XP_037806330.1 elongation of very long chain fatty acids protein [Lucilia sericata]XP_03780633